MVNENYMKGLINSNDFIVRCAALSYFNESYSRDSEVIDRVIDAIRKYDDSFERNYLMANCENLNINETQINELMSLDYGEDIYLKNNIVTLAIKQGIDIIESFYDRIQEKKFFINKDSSLELFEHYNKLKTLDECSTENLLKQLKDLAKNNEERKENDFDYNKGINIGKILSDREDLNLDYIVKELKNENSKYYIIYLVYILGELRNKSCIDILISKLKENDDLTNEVIGEALSKIGGDTVIQAVYKKMLECNNTSIKLYISMVFESIKTDFSAETCFKLLEKENTKTMRGVLASALCKSYEVKYIDYIADIVKNENYNKSILNLKRELLATAKINNVKLKNIDCLQRRVEYKLDDLKDVNLSL